MISTGWGLFIMQQRYAVANAHALLDKASTDYKPVLQH
jgi:hypothetical protein